MRAVDEGGVPASAPVTSRLFVLPVAARRWVLTDNSVTAPTSAPPLKLSTTLHWPTPFWLRRSPSSRRERSQANPSAAAHRAGHPVAVSPPFFEPEPSPSHSTSPRTSTAPSRARPSPIPAESAPSPLDRRRRLTSPATLLHDPASPTVPNPDSTQTEVALYLLELFPHFPLNAGDRARRNPAGQRRRAPSPIPSPVFAPKSGSSGFGTWKFRVSS